MHNNIDDASSVDGSTIRIVPADTLFKNRKKNPWTRGDSDGSSDDGDDPRQLFKGGVRLRFHRIPKSEMRDSKSESLHESSSPGIHYESINGHFDKFIKDSDEYKELVHMVKTLSQAVQEEESSSFSLEATTAEFKAHFMDVLNLKAAKGSPRPRALKSEVIRNLGSLKGYKSFIRNPSISLRKVACLTKYLHRKGYYVSFAPSSNLVKNSRRRPLRKDSLVDSDSQSLPNETNLPNGDTLEAVSSNSDASR